MIPICRGKTKLDPARWIFGCLVFDPDDMKPIGIIQHSEVGHPLDIPYMRDGCVDGNLPEVIKETIGMYTGMDDAAGTQIYEGDIVEPRLVIGPHAGYDFGKKDGGVPPRRVCAGGLHGQRICDTERPEQRG